MRQFGNIIEQDKFILTAPRQEVEKYLQELMGKEAFDKYMQELREYEDTLIHGTGIKQPMGILNFEEEL